jgi:glucose/mannose-6-phosphate isomerase
MSNILNDRAQIAKLDQSNVLGSVESLAYQISDTMTQLAAFSVPSSYHDVKNIVVSGMGGSVLASHIIKQLYKHELKVPFDVVSHYNLPGYVDENSLVILASYSGSTEETLTSAAETKAKGAKVMVITGGGKLADMARAENWPMYQINPTHNPSGQPRLAIGYAVAGQLLMLGKAGLISDPSQELQAIIPALTHMVATLGPEAEQSFAKTLAYAAYEKHIIFVAAEHLIGAAHVFNNQVNENAKTLTSEWHLPEFNHHYMEALSFPHATRENTLFILFNSALYHERVQKRVLLTKSLLEQKGYEAQVILATAPSKLKQVFEVIQIGEYVAAYLPILYGIDPAAIPNVDWFKTEMAK